MGREPQPPRLFSHLRARAFAARLPVDVRQARVCVACLGLVAWPVEQGDEREALSWARRMTPDLWREGVADYALPLVRAARDTGVLEADAALADLELNGPDSAVARAIVLRLAAALAQRTRTAIRLEEAARPRLAAAAPELN